MVFNNLLLDSRSFTKKQIKEEDLQLTKSLMNCVAAAILLVGLDAKVLNLDTELYKSGGFARI